MASRVEISKRLLLINSASSIAGQVLQFSVQLWLHQHLARRISASDYSVYWLVQAIVAFVPLFTGVLTYGLGRYVMEAYAREDDDRVRQIVSTMVPLLSIAGLLLLLVGGLVSWHVDWVLKKIPEGLIWDARLMMFMLVFSMAIQLPCTPMGLGLWIRQKFMVTSSITICAEILKSAVLLVLLLLVSTRVLWVVVATVVGQMFSLCVNMFLSLRAVPNLRYRYRRIRWDLVRAITGFGGWSFLLTLAVRTREYAIPLILNRMGTAIDINTYSLGSMGRRQIDQWFDVASRPVHPLITGMYAMGAKERYRSAYLRGGRVGLWVILAVSLPAMIFSKPLIDLYTGGAYPEASIVLAISLACYVLSSGNWMAWIMASAKAQIRPLAMRVSLAQFSGVLLTLAVTAWLGMGAVGAAIAVFMASAFSVVFFSLPIGLRLAEVTPEVWVRQTLVPGLAPGCVAAVVWTSLSVFARPDSWLEIGWCVLAGGLCYVAVLLALCMEPKDRADLVEIIRRVRNRFVAVGSGQ